jgi:hypothetical protein
MADILAKARAGRTVLKRTTSTQGGELPRLVLYMEWLAGESRRRVIDTDGQEHRIPDRIIESSYKLVTGGQAEELLHEHWPSAAPPRPAPEAARPTPSNGAHAKPSAPAAKAKPAAKAESKPAAGAKSKKPAASQKRAR